MVIPTAVKKILVDEYYKVVHQRSLRDLPAERPVAVILSDYLTAKKKALKDAKDDIKVSKNNNIKAVA